MNKSIFVCLFLNCFLTLACWANQPILSDLKVSSPPIELEGEARSIQDYVNVKEISILVDYIAMPEIHRRLVNGLEERADDGEVPEEISKVVTQLSEQVTATFLTSVNKYDSIEYLNYRSWKDKHYVTYRVGQGESEDFLIFQFSKLSDEWKVVDWFFYSTESWMCEAVEELLWFVFSEGNRLIYLEDFIMAARKEPQKAMALFDELPDYYKEEKMVLGIAFNSLKNVAESERAIAVKKLLSYAHDDDFLLFRYGYHYTLGEYDTAIFYAEALNNALGGVPSLELIQSEILYSSGNKKKAKNVLLDVMSKTDDDQALYAALLLLVKGENFELAVNVLDLLKTVYFRELNRQVLSQINDYLPLLESEAFIAWDTQGKKG